MGYAQDFPGDRRYHGPNDQPRDIHVKVWLTESERRKYEELADIYNCNVSAGLRWLLDLSYDEVAAEVESMKTSVQNTMVSEDAQDQVLAIQGPITDISNASSENPLFWEGYAVLPIDLVARFGLPDDEASLATEGRGLHDSYLKVIVTKAQEQRIKQIQELFDAKFQSRTVRWMLRVGLNEATRRAVALRRINISA